MGKGSRPAPTWRGCCSATRNPERRTPYWPGFVDLVDAAERTRGFGDYYGYCLVARGQAEIYAEVDLKIWDWAPMKVIVEEAGGRVTDLEGRPIDLETRSILATNGRLHEAVLDELGR